MARVALMDADAWRWKHVGKSGTAVAHSIGEMGVTGYQARRRAEESIPLDAGHIWNCARALLDSEISSAHWAKVCLEATWHRKPRAFLPERVALESRAFPVDSEEEAPTSTSSKRQRTHDGYAPCGYRKSWR